MARDGLMVYHDLLEWIEPFGDAECGRLLRAMLTYSMTGETEELSGNEKYIWPAVRAKIDKDKEAYASKCQQMQANATKSYQKQAEATKSSPTTTTTTTTTTTASPSERETAHSYGEYLWVKLTDAQYEKLQQDLGQEELDRCIKYVDESAQSTGNKNKWKDWNLTIRKCSRDGWGKVQTAQVAKAPTKYVTAASYKPPKPDAKTDVWALVDQI